MIRLVLINFVNEFKGTNEKNIQNKYLKKNVKISPSQVRTEVF